MTIARRIATWIEPCGMARRARRRKTYPLHLVSSQPRYRLHSQMDAGPVSARGKVAGREAVAINPADAARARHRGRRRGARPQCARRLPRRRRRSPTRSRPGVVRLSCGAWYDPADADDGALCAHGNANVLTRDRGTSKLGQGPSSATALVEVERWTGPVPPVAAFVPPVIAGDAA